MFSIVNWVHSTQGMIHFVASIIALATSLFVIFAKKGTKIHKQIGVVFSIALVLVNLSALFIYDFNNGSIGPFHYLIPVSIFFLLYGWLPMLKKKKSPQYMNKHIIGMIGAALGLWAAGATEYYVREIVVEGMEKNEQVLYSFLISAPFAILITIMITYHLKQLKTKN